MMMHENYKVFQAAGGASIKAEQNPDA